MYDYLKALHIVFVVTWFAGLFYIPRLHIYIIEANEKNELEKNAVQQQLQIMLKRLWMGITWPSAIITLLLGITVLINGNWWRIIAEKEGRWLLYKIILVLLLYGYHFSLEYLYKKTSKNLFPYSAQAIRYWNEVPTLLLIAIVTLVVVKQSTSFVWVTGGMGLLVLLLLLAIRVYKKIRGKQS